MKDALAFAAYLALPLIGLVAWRIEAVRRLPLDGRIAVAGAMGAVITTLVMASLSFLGIRWNRPTLFAIFTILAICSAGLRPAGSPASGRHEPRAGRPRNGGRDARATLFIAGFILLISYGLLTARATQGDLLFFWGPKGIHFYRAGEISLGFLANFTNPNPDYPPLLPLLYAWSQVVARSFSWWSALLLSALFLAGAVAIVRACSGDDAGAALVAALLSWTFAFTFAGGSGDPPLIFFVTLTLSSLTFLDDVPGRDLLAALGLAGAALTKVEGASFLIAVVLAVAIVQRSIKRAMLIAVPAVIALAGWALFLSKIGLVYGYGRSSEGQQIHFEAIPRVLRAVIESGGYAAYGLPFLIPLALIAFGRTHRAALLPLSVAALTFGAIIFFYINADDPSWWIAASAPRVLITPLTALIIASVAAWRRPAI